MIGMFLSVGAGGAIGAMTRYGIAVWMAERFGAASWTATLAVNIAGCFSDGDYCCLSCHFCASF